MDYYMHIEMREGELRETMEELVKAQETIQRCYFKLRKMGVVTIREETAKEIDGLPAEELT